MIKTKGGYEVRIVKGDKKCLSGKKAFLVETVITQEEIMKKISDPLYTLSPIARIYLRRDELVYDSISELESAILKTKEKVAV